MVLVAVDAGYCDTKVVGQVERFKFPSVIGVPRPRTLISDRMDCMAELHVDVDGREWFVGSLALRESTDASRTLDGCKIETTVVLCLVSAALLMHGEAASIELVTGLPVAHCRAQRDDLRARLVGKHVVKFLAGRLTGKTTVLYLSRVLVFPQGAGAFFSHVLDAYGRPVEREQNRGLWSLVDIGYRTTDIATFTDLAYVDRQSGSLALGISDAHKAILKRWNEQGREVLLADVEQEARPEEPEFREIATKILRNVRPITGSARLLFAGGGALALRQHLPGPVLLEGEYANAVGFYRVGLARMGGAS